MRTPVAPELCELRATIAAALKSFKTVLVWDAHMAALVRVGCASASCGPEEDREGSAQQHERRTKKTSVGVS